MYQNNLNVRVMYVGHQYIWNLATPDIDVYVDMEDYDIEVFFGYRIQ